jgi:2-aminomuconate deaminase
VSRPGDELTSDRAPEPVGPFPHAKRVGNLLFLSGIGPRRRGSREIPGVTLGPDGEVASYDIAEQCRAVFRNVRTVLEDAGSSWDRIVDVTVFLTDMRRDFATFNRIYGEHFDTNRPARTTVEVGRLPSDMAPDAVQQGNRTWWTERTMAYDWHGEISDPRFERAWYDEIDRRFLHGARLFTTAERPFDGIIPFDRIAGRDVLEIGCGMGLHSELMLRAGARLRSVDLSPTSVRATRTRLELKGLAGDVREADAEQLPFEAASFDFVWSWGVIHHSARTGRIAREIARVLRPGGSCRIMVYNREGMAARVAFWRDHVGRLGFLKRSFEETLYRTTDGFTARYYVREQFEDLFRAFFSEVSSQVLGLEADVIPLPRHLRRLVVPFVSEGYLRRAQARRGGFLFLEARDPC